MSLEKLMEAFKQNNPGADGSNISACHNFLVQSLQMHKCENSKQLIEKAENLALDVITQKAGVKFINACLLLDLPTAIPAIYPEIKKHCGEEMVVFLKAWQFIVSHWDTSSDRQLIDHSFGTALRISETNIDFDTVTAALLHEVPLVLKLEKKEMTKLFNEPIAKIVDNFRKITYLRVGNRPKFINNLREMVLAMAQDLRVILIKMCSNIERMKNSQNDDSERVEEIAHESLEIMAPLADLLGTWRLRWQLEDYAFKVLQPEEYERIAKRFNEDEKKNREDYIQKIRNIVIKAAEKTGIKCSVNGRFKHFYSIYQKMKFKNKTFNEITDVFALRIIVDNPDNCYRMLGIIHQLWKPKPRRIKDYIADPKDNNYQSLHTTVFGLNGRLTEFQIRTGEMDEQAKFGIASHWNYKNKSNNNPAWIQELLLKQQKYSDDEEFYTSFTSEILNGRIYVYTPKGDVIALPSGATPVDFAYHIHTQVGNKCTGAIINDLPGSLDYKLQTNDIVQILTDRDQLGPKSEWLQFVKTASARKNIWEYINKTPISKIF